MSAMMASTWWLWGTTGGGATWPAARMMVEWFGFAQPSLMNVLIVFSE